MPAKFEPPPVQPIDDVRIVAGHLHLRDRLDADDGLVHAATWLSTVPSA